MVLRPPVPVIPAPPRLIAVRIRSTLSAALAIAIAACAPRAAAPGEREEAPTTTVAIMTTTTEAASYQGIPVGLTDEGYPYLGAADAPVTVVEFSDYLCPYCGRHFQQTSPALVEQYAVSGRVRFVFRDFPIAELHPNAPAGHAAALCVAEQGAGLFWAMHDALFSTQEAWADLADPADYLEQTALGVGADRAAYGECVASGRTADLVAARVAEARSFGFSGTPSFLFEAAGQAHELVGAYPLATFQAWVDALLAGDQPPPVEGEQTEQEVPFWATVEGAAPDPARPGYTVAGDEWRGDPAAPVVVVEISDFQCPFCRQHTLETQPALDEQYVASGQVRWVFKHLPLDIHPQATSAAVAAECAAEQGAFWEMHDLLFERVEEWAVAVADPALVVLAGDLGLDQAAFEACLASRAALERVLADVKDLTGVIGSTPSFVVIAGERVGLVEGARPLEQFVAAFDELLAP